MLDRQLHPQEEEVEDGEDAADEHEDRPGGQNDGGRNDGGQNDGGDQGGGGQP